MRSPLVTAGLAWLLTASQAGAECACLCVDGTAQTVCSSPAEMRAAGNRCRDRAPPECPATPESDGGRFYQPPVEGVGRCRDAQVYDPREGRYVTARVCDMLPGR